MALFGGSKSSTVVNETYEQYDNRVGVDGEGIIALGSGATYNYVTDVPTQIVDMFATLGDVAKSALAIGVSAVDTATGAAQQNIKTVADLKLAEVLGTDSQFKPILIVGVVALGIVGVVYFWKKG